MAHLTITERQRDKDGAVVAVSVDHGEFHEVSLGGHAPEWAGSLFEAYLGDFPRLPFLHRTQAAKAAERIQAYGEELFCRLMTPELAPRYEQAAAQGLAGLEIAAQGMYLFHSDHWETLKDPNLPHPLAYYGPVIRRVSNPYFPAEQPRLQPSPLVNILLVSARPDGLDGLRGAPWGRPVVESLQQANLPVRVDVLRPPTFAALRDLLGRQAVDGAGFYHLVIFDAPVAMLAHAELEDGVAAGRYLDPAAAGRGPVQPYERKDAFLLLDSGLPLAPADAVHSRQLSRFLVEQHVPAVLLNACHPAVPVRPGEQNVNPVSALAVRLLLFGLPAAICAAYPLTGSALRHLMPALAGALAAGQPLAQAVHAARQALYEQPERLAGYDQPLALRDWMALACYQAEPVRIPRRLFEIDEARAYYSRGVQRFPPPITAQRFAGREADALRIERRLLGEAGGLLLVHGRGGVGKSALLQHLGAWWQSTRLVEEVFHFDFARQAWTVDEMVAQAARRLLPAEQYQHAFEPAGPPARLDLLSGALNGPRHLFLLDNFGPGNLPGLPAEERGRLFGLLAALRDSQALALIGARSPEEWLRPANGGGALLLQPANLLELEGLDAAAQAALLARITGPEQVGDLVIDAALDDLLQLLDGHPLAMQVTCARLPAEQPLALVQALEIAPPDPALPPGLPAPRATSAQVLDALHELYSGFTAAEQDLLACLAPFNQAVDVLLLDGYHRILAARPEMAPLDFARWEEVLQQARRASLVYPRPGVPGMLNIQAIVSYYLKHRFERRLSPAQRDCLRQVFRDSYAQAAARWMDGLRDPSSAVRRAAQEQVGLEWPNLQAALEMCFAARVSFIGLYRVMRRYLQDTQGLEAAQRFTRQVTERQGAYQPVLRDAPGVDFLEARLDLGAGLLEAKQLGAAREQFQQARSLLTGVVMMPVTERLQRMALLERQQAEVYQAEGNFVEAEKRYRHALRQLNQKENALEQAETFKRYAALYLAQKRWDRAEVHLRSALRIYQAVEADPASFAGARADQRPNRLDVLVRLAEAYQGLGDQKLALEHTKLAAEISDSLAAEFDERSRAGDADAWERAAAAYGESLGFYTRLNRRYDCSRIQLALARGSARHDRLDAAAGYYQQACEIYVLLNALEPHAVALLELGWVNERQNHPADALRHYRRALENAVTLQQDDLRQRALSSIAAFASRFKDPGASLMVAQVLGITPAQAQEMLDV